MTLGSPALDALDKPGLRTPLAIALGVRRSRQFGRTVAVARRRGMWTFTMDGRALAPEMHGWADTREWDRLANDVFFWCYEPKSGDVVVDVGAGIGTELFAYAARIGEDGIVYALEAHPTTFKRLCALFELNRGRALKTPMVLDCLAATDHDGTIQIADSDDDIGNWLVASGGIPTTAITLDRYVTTRNIERIDFLKMNIEGAETEALRAAAHTLSITRNGAISCHDFKAKETGNSYFRTKVLVRSLLLEAGFEVEERPGADDPWTRDYLYITRR